MDVSKCTRRAGILLPLTALPSPCGIGTLGAAAFRFVDFLTESGQSLWQVLPIGPIRAGWSPYQSTSAFAGNPLLIDLDVLVKEDVLTKKEADAYAAAASRPKGQHKDTALLCGSGAEGESGQVSNRGRAIVQEHGSSGGTANYAFQMRRKLPLLRAAAERLDGKNANYRRFLRENAEWLEGYALFDAIHEHLRRPLQGWPEALQRPSDLALAELRDVYSADIEISKRTQFFFFQQWKELKSYANLQGVGIVGDLPFYVSEDSADFWLNRRAFDVFPDGRPASVAGVPPDAFSAEGQIWDNPVYAWGKHKKEVFDFWQARLKQAIRLYDSVRIDHFRAFSEYYAIPLQRSRAPGKNGRRGDLGTASGTGLSSGFVASSAARLRPDSNSGIAANSGPGASLRSGASLGPVPQTQIPRTEDGAWRPGPSRAFIDRMRADFPGLHVIAEDLGILTEEADALLRYSGFPGMKVMQFAFSDGNPFNAYLPHNIGANSVVYTGTHDNDTTCGWLRGITREQAGFALRYFGLARRADLPDALLRAALGSTAESAIIPLQDWLGLGSSARFNTPGTCGGRNWKWRVPSGALTKELSARIRFYTKDLYGR
jgi:4-alpha-glucanotransferase